MSQQISWGIPFTEVFQLFGERAKTSLVKRAANLVVEIAHSGGNTSDVLKAAATDAYEVKALESDRRVSMTTYLIVIYVVFLVFLSVVSVLDAVFIPKVVEATESATARFSGTSGTALEQASQSGGEGVGLFSSKKVDPVAIRHAYFNAVLVQGIGNGLVAGVIRENRVSSGLRHVFIMVVIAYATFRFLVT